MKKTLAAILALCMFMMVFCAACGGGEKEETPAAEQTAQATELPTVTPPPAGEEGPAGIAAEENDAPELTNAGEQFVSEDHKTAAGLVGKDVSELYKAIGEPERTEYVVGCYENGDDGLLYYDGFYVNTYRYTNGTETILGAFAD